MDFKYMEENGLIDPSYADKFNLMIVNNMEAQEAKLYRGEEYIKSLCLLGLNDDFDEIVVEKDGTMTVSTFEDVFNEKTREYEAVSRTYKGITRISFK